MRSSSEIERDLKRPMGQRKDELLVHAKAETHPGSPARYRGLG